MEKNDLLYDTVKLSEKLEDLRKEKKYTLKTLSKQIEEKTGVYISHSQLGKYENTEIAERININNLLAMAYFYDVSLEYLLGKTNSKSKSYTDQMTAKKFGLTDKSMDNLQKTVKNSLYYPLHKIEVINCILEDDDFLNNLTYSLWDFFKNVSNENYFKNEEERNNFYATRYILSQLFDKFIDKAVEKFVPKRNIKKSYLFDMPEDKKLKKENKKL